MPPAHWLSRGVAVVTEVKMTTASKSGYNETQENRIPGISTVLMYVLQPIYRNGNHLWLQGKPAKLQGLQELRSTT
jgi:hypothetical protein